MAVVRAATRPARDCERRRCEKDAHESDEIAAAGMGRVRACGTDLGVVAQGKVGAALHEVHLDQQLPVVEALQLLQERLDLLEALLELVRVEVQRDEADLGWGGGRRD